IFRFLEEDSARGNDRGSVGRGNDFTGVCVDVELADLAKWPAHRRTEDHRHEPAASLGVACRARHPSRVEGWIVKQTILYGNELVPVRYGERHGGRSAACCSLDG